ncbi:carboxymuconolactone decarboxylase [Veronia nyctiphanis]|uniref:Carboxymuconolactone decarboxylase n=1 Tax=Veronia nyctiphanis TaxID=1278244 RepID=A0A4Q0YFU5_9GAMM|nr:carboxymuconolactone decarboxylase family protein [Veronia nyctiphanis]RXJ69055.1 carboxymuconolactone decarboxylase [Veronia nyctiphanis]
MINENFAPIPDTAWPAEITSLKEGFAGKLNVYRVMAHHPRLLESWTHLRDHVVVKNSLGAQWSEIIILRSGVNLKSDYEWSHHVSRARICGLSDSRILSIKGNKAKMVEEDNVLCSAVDELFQSKKLSELTKARLRALVGDAGMLDVIATVGFYSTLGYILNSFDTPIDNYIQNEMERNPL